MKTFFKCMTLISVLSATSAFAEYAKVTCITTQSKDSFVIRPNYLIINPKDIQMDTAGIFVKGDSLELSDLKLDENEQECRDFYWVGQTSCSGLGNSRHCYTSYSEIQRDWNVASVSVGNSLLLSCQRGSSVEIFKNKDQFVKELSYGSSWIQSEMNSKLDGTFGENKTGYKYGESSVSLLKCLKTNF